MLFVFIPVVFYGYSELVEQTGMWLHELSIEIGNKQDLGIEATNKEREQPQIDFLIRGNILI